MLRTRWTWLVLVLLYWYCFQNTENNSFCFPADRRMGLSCSNIVQLSSLIKSVPPFAFIDSLIQKDSRIERLNCQNLRFSQLCCHLNYMLLYQIVSCLTLLYIALIFFQDTEIHVTTVGAGVLKQSCITGKVSVLKF